MRLEAHSPIVSRGGRDPGQMDALSPHKQNFLYECFRRHLQDFRQVRRKLSLGTACVPAEHVADASRQAQFAELKSSWCELTRISLEKHDVQ